MLPHFYYHPRMLSYDFGPQHPLKPERLRRAVELLGKYGVKPVDPGPGSEADPSMVHSPEYVEVVRDLSSSPYHRVGTYGFGSLDNPPFKGMYESSLAYTSGSARAAEAVRDGASLAFGLAGGLHHAHRDRASGFCIFNDAAVAIAILKERFDRIAYIDIDVHHGDGVQWIFYEDPTVMTCSIHEGPRTLFPGTGGVEETGESFTSLNVPLPPGTTGDTWLWAFREGILSGLEAFDPDALVLQMGTDAHYLDPLAHVQITAQDWLEAVTDIKRLGLPTVAVGGGGYNLTTVPRMWAAACLTLGSIPFEDRLPEDLAEAWGIPSFFDDQIPGPPESGMGEARTSVEWLQRHLLPRIPRR